MGIYFDNQIKCKYFLVSLLLYDAKLNILGLEGIIWGFEKQVIE